jgi:uncharacterized protein (DUF983 family)
MGTLVWRAMRLRCPVCGQGRMFCGLKSLDTCAHCGFRFEREVGYFTNALILNYTITSLPILLIVAPLAYFSGLSVWTLIIGGLVIALLLPILAYRHSKSLWLAFDLAARPPHPIEFAPPDQRAAPWQPDR